MLFDKSRVYTVVNAEELEPGDKVIVANSIGYIKDCLRKDDYVVDELTDVLGEFEQERFGVGEIIRYFSLAYIVERKENCTNCALSERTDASDDEEYECSPKGYIGDKERAKICRCLEWKSKTEQKTEHDCQSCKYKSCGFKAFNTKNDCDRWETEQKVEKQYRPFINTAELVKVWDAKYKEKYGLERIDKGLDMPYIWVRYKMNQCGQIGILITKYEKNYVQIDGDMIAMHALMADYEFLDGSPCGVEE